LPRGVVTENAACPNHLILVSCADAAPAETNVSANRAAVNTNVLIIPSSKLLRGETRKVSPLDSLAHEP
jgi:hypothetical protein